MVCVYHVTLKSHFGTYFNKTGWNWQCRRHRNIHHLNVSINFNPNSFNNRLTGPAKLTLDHFLSTISRSPSHGAELQTIFISSVYVQLLLQFSITWTRLGEMFILLVAVRRVVHSQYTSIWLENIRIRPLGNEISSKQAQEKRSNYIWCSISCWKHGNRCSVLVSVYVFERFSLPLSLRILAVLILALAYDFHRVELN